LSTAPTRSPVNTSTAMSLMNFVAAERIPSVGGLMSLMLNQPPRANRAGLPSTPPREYPSTSRTPDTPPERAAALSLSTPAVPMARVTSGRMIASPPDSANAPPVGETNMCTSRPGVYPGRTPPSANLGTLPISSAPTMLATLFQIERMPLLKTVSIRKLTGLFAESRMPSHASEMNSFPDSNASFSQSTPSITFSKAGLIPFSQIRVMCPEIQFHTGRMTRSLNQLNALANAPRMNAITSSNLNFVSVHQR